jgi:hypothetical protein
MEPGSKRCVPTKSTDLAKELDEDILCQVLSLGHTSRHAETEKINTTMMLTVDLFESPKVASGGKLHVSIYHRHGSILLAMNAKHPTA